MLRHALRPCLMRDLTSQICQTLRSHALLLQQRCSFSSTTTLRLEPCLAKAARLDDKRKVQNLVLAKQYLDEALELPKIKEIIEEEVGLKLKPRRTGDQAYTVLAIETSCDDTCIAVLRFPHLQSRRVAIVFDVRVTSDNSKHGGIHILNALESHQRNLAPILRRYLKHNREVMLPDLIAVTRGPGMRPNLQTGLDFAKGLSVAWNVPILGVHHMLAHALTPRLQDALSWRDHDTRELTPKFPYLSLLISGGHTLLVLSRSVTEHEILASTADTAIGDCLDKVGRTIFLPFLDQFKSVSYGAHLEKYGFMDGKIPYDYSPPKSVHEETANSRQTTKYGWYIPAPLLSARNGEKRHALQFSFSGIEASVSRIAAFGCTQDTPREKAMPDDERRLIARVVMRVAFEHLANRVCLFLESQKSDSRDDGVDIIKTLTLGGGVAANAYLKHILRKYLDARGFENIGLMATDSKFCTDNAVMIGWAAAEMMGLTTGEGFDSSKADFAAGYDMRALRKWSLKHLMQPEVEEQRDAEELRIREESRSRKTATVILPQAVPTSKMEKDEERGRLRLRKFRRKMCERRMVEKGGRDKSGVETVSMSSSSMKARESGEDVQQMDATSTPRIDIPPSSSELEILLLKLQNNPDALNVRCAEPN